MSARDEKTDAIPRSDRCQYSTCRYPATVTGYCDDHAPINATSRWWPFIVQTYGCGCTARLSQINPCPLHAAAPAMREALKQAQRAFCEGWAAADAPFQAAAQIAAVIAINAALAQARGETVSR